MNGKETCLATALSRLRRFRSETRGATAVEYGLIVSLLAVAIMALVFTIGENIKTVLYGAIGNALN